MLRVLSIAGGALAILAAVQTPAPSDPVGSRLLYHDPVGNRLVLVGATAAGQRPDLLPVWEWRAGAWSVLRTSGPSMRTVTAAAYDSHRRRLVLYGGLGSAADRRDDTWEWDGVGWHAMADRSAGARDHHAMTFDEARRRIVLFGGVTAPADARQRPAQGDTWTWDGVRWQLAATSGPSARGTTLIDDPARQQVLLFGGVGGQAQRLGDTWAWNGRDWRQLGDSGPPARNGHAMAFDRRAEVVLLFGGTTGPRHLDDFWQWDGRRWTEIHVEGPRPGGRVGAALAYDAGRDRTVLYGGHAREDGRVRDSTEMWEWDRRRWTRVR